MNNRLCMQCGSVYHSPVTCCCPECGEGVIWQQVTKDESVFKASHKLAPDYIYRPKKSGMSPEFVPHQVEQYREVEDYEQSPVIIDYLTFTVKISHFQHCKRIHLTQEFTSLSLLSTTLILLSLQKILRLTTVIFVSHT